MSIQFFRSSLLLKLSYSYLFLSLISDSKISISRPSCKPILALLSIPGYNSDQTFFKGTTIFILNKVTSYVSLYYSANKAGTSKVCECVCVCVCARACVCMCMCARVCACVYLPSCIYLVVLYGTGAKLVRFRLCISYYPI